MIEESQKLTPAQEREFFSIVTERDVMYLVWDELINIGYTVISMLAELEGGLVDWLYQDQIEEVSRIVENMQNPRFPQDQFAGAAKYVLEACPYRGDIYPLLKQRFGDTPQIRQIELYFYDPQICLFSRVFPEYR